MSKFTLTDTVVKSSLKKIGSINEARPDLRLITVGGLAVQIYSQNSSLYRPTSDLDLMTPYNMSPIDFKNDFGKDFSDYFDEQGYSTKLRKARYGYEMNVIKGDESFFVHLSKFSEAYLDNHSHWKQREFDNAKLVSVPALDGRYVLLHRIEDIFANKARRLGNLKHHGYLTGKDTEAFNSFLEFDFESLGRVDLIKTLTNVEAFRDSLIFIRPENFSTHLDIFNSYKVKKDLYDVALLSRTVLDGKESLDRDYLKLALSTIPTINNPNPI